MHGLLTAEGGSSVPRRVLVVDDNDGIRRLLNDVLTSEGLEVLEATTGEEAVARAEREAVDLVLMDIELPGIDGDEAMRRIRALPGRALIPVIAVSSYARSGDGPGAAAAGYACYVAKPFSPCALLDEVRRFL